MADDLKPLLRRARDADGLTRIELRDPIAVHGTAAIEALKPWLEDVKLAAFAVRTIEKAAGHGAKRDAIAALSAARPSAPSDAIRRDIDASLEHLQPRHVRPSGGDPYAVGSLPQSAGSEWSGFQESDFRTMSGSSWRSRDGRTSLAPILTTALRYAHPHFESYPVERSPELHLAIRERYRPGGETVQGWRAGKLVVYAHGPRAGELAEQPAQVAAGLYLEKGDGSESLGSLDDGWDWPWFLRALGTDQFADDLARTMVAHELSIGDYVGGGFRPASSRGVGFIGRYIEGELVIDDADGGRGYGFDELVERLEALPGDRWADLHLWRTWPAEEAVTAGRSFAFDELIPVLSDLTAIYLDIVGEPLSRLASPA